MPSGITHFLLAREFTGKIKNKKLRAVLSDGIYFFETGAVAPDLPYSSIADTDILHSEADLADDFHYKKTNQLTLQAINQLKASAYRYSTKELRYIFSFFLGYVSHVIADGLMHPFIRDMVGDYEENKFEHRQLEMRLDVLYYDSYTKSSGGQEFNYSNIHDELTNLRSYSQTKPVLELFSQHIKTIYNKDFDYEKILGWIDGLHTLLGIAEGEHPQWYAGIPLIGDQLYSDFNELKEKEEDLIILKKPVDGVPQNFLHVDRINFFEDCVPKFFSVFKPIAEKAFNCIYFDGDELTEEDIPPVDLDTGRPLGQRNELYLIPTLWR